MQCEGDQVGGQDNRVKCEYVVEMRCGSRSGWTGLTRAATLDEARELVRKRVDNGWDRDAYRIVKVTREVVEWAKEV